METLASLILVALEIVVQLGVPVVVIFLMGFAGQRAERRRFDLRGPKQSRPTRPGRIQSGPAPRGINGTPAFQLRACPAIEPTQVLTTSPIQSCWQAVRPTSGRLRSECIACGSFLVPPVTR